MEDPQRGPPTTLGLGPLCCSAEGVSLSHKQHLGSSVSKVCCRLLVFAVSRARIGPGREQAPVWKLWLYNHMWGSF